jgi:hypothetical protein
MSISAMRTRKKRGNTSDEVDLHQRLNSLLMGSELVLIWLDKHDVQKMGLGKYLALKFVLNDL